MLLIKYYYPSFHRETQKKYVLLCSALSVVSLFRLLPIHTWDTKRELLRGNNQGVVFYC